MFGLQFHPEVTRPIVAAWITAADPPVDPSLAARMLRDAADTRVEATANAGALFSAWLDGGFATP